MTCAGAWRRQSVAVGPNSAVALFAGVAITQPPEFPAVRIDVQEEPVAVAQLRSFPPRWNFGT
jgi:hypothetical protein